MHDELLNKGYALALEFGKNWRRPIIEIIQEMNTSLSLDEQLELSKTISKTRKEIEDYFYEQVDHKNDSKNNELIHTGKQWIKETYPWMSEKVCASAISQAMYYAWRG